MPKQSRLQVIGRNLKTIKFKEKCFLSLCYKIKIKNFESSYFR